MGKALDRTVGEVLASCARSREMLSQMITGAGGPVRSKVTWSYAFESRVAAK
jgi:hypothetical protein